MWLTRDTTQPAIFPEQPDVPCAACGHGLRQSPSHWATWQELVQLSWDADVIDTGTSWLSESHGRAASHARPAELDVVPEDVSEADVDDRLDVSRDPGDLGDTSA